MEPMMIARAILFVSLLITAFTPPVYCESKETDAAQLGLRGPVQTFFERKANFKDYNGDWIQERTALVRKIEFTKTGYKIEERSFVDAGTLNYKITYEYDESGRLIGREERAPWRLAAAWSKTFSDDGSSTLLIRYNYDGSLKSKLTQRFDPSGEKLAEIEYDQTVNRRWVKEYTDTGSTIRYRPRWGANEVTHFNRRGQITEKRWSRGDIPQRWEYTYDQDGKLTEGRFYENTRTLLERYKSAYDSRGNLIALTHTLGSGSTVSRRSYTYNEENRLTSQTAEWFDEQGAPARTWTYAYDSEGNLVERKYSHGDGSFSCRWSYRYNDRNDRTEETFLDSRDRAFSVNRTTYDTKGNKVFEESAGRGVSQGYRVIYEYDPVGRMIENLRLDSSGARVSRETFRYNAGGDLIENNQYNFDDSLRSGTKYVYIYDRGGNWIERKTLMTDNARERYDAPVNIVFRSFTYHPETDSAQ